MTKPPKPQMMPDGRQQPHLAKHIKRHLDRQLHRNPISVRKRQWSNFVYLKCLGESEGPNEEIPERPKLDPFVSQPSPKSEKPTMRVYFQVPYRCHSRQLLCMGGSQFPFGWSFVSIAKIPMTWHPGDRWTAEVYLPLGMRLEYKYVILEEQVWTNQQDEDSEGIVEVTYRTGTTPGQPPDVHKIRKQMAIVDWQPGPNRVIQIPSRDEIDRLTPGGKMRRTPARPRSYVHFGRPGNALKKASNGTWEELSLDSKENPILKRHDIWPNKETYLSFDEAQRFFEGNDHF